MGGIKTLSTRGRDFYSEIGRLGQNALRFKYPCMASQWGRMGGRPKKLNLFQPGGAVAKKKKEDADPPFIHHSPSTTISPTG